MFRIALLGMAVDCGLWTIDCDEMKLRLSRVIQLHFVTMALATATVLTCERLT